MNLPGWAVLSDVTLPSGTHRVRLMQIEGGRKFQLQVAPDEWQIHGVSRLTETLAAIPGPPEIRY